MSSEAPLSDSTSAPLPAEKALPDETPPADPAPEEGVQGSVSLAGSLAGEGNGSAGLPFPLGLLLPALERRGFEQLTPIQEAVLAEELDGRDLQISSQTGSGKTLALGFAIARHLGRSCAGSGKGPRALIIVPTRELAAQVCRELRWLFADLDLRLGVVTGGTPIFRDKRMLAGKPRILVGTPGRLLDHVRSGNLDLSGVEELVLDEADQMLDMGFREELTGLLDQTPAERRTHLVSATFPPLIRDLAARYQREPVLLEGTPLGEVHQDIAHEGYLVHSRNRYDLLVNLLLLRQGERTLVFVERRSDAIEVAERLESDGFSALPLSGELAQSQRERTLQAFREGRVTVLVATDVAARGLDVPDVPTVIQTAPPIDAEVYIHRSGRTGRAGQSGSSLLFVPANRRRRVERMLADVGIELTWKEAPQAAAIENELSRRTQEARRARLESLLEKGADQEARAEAASLLEGRDPEAVVAALLTQLAPPQKTRPRDLPRHESRTGSERRGRDGGGYDRGGYSRGGGQRGVYRQAGSQYQGSRKPRSENRGYGQARGSGRGTFRAPQGDSVRFFINWGRNQGANPSRLLAAICRRGGVTGADIGSIAIHPNASTFDVNARVAERFERLAGRRDARDPHTRIRRDRGPRAGH